MAEYISLSGKYSFLKTGLINRLSFFVLLFIIVTGFDKCASDKPVLQNKNCSAHIKRSSNSADTLKSGTSRDLLCVNMYSAGSGYISGENGVILKTLNAGNNWFALTSGTGEDLKGIYAIDPDTAVTVGNAGLILRTKNKGNDWESVSSGTAQDLNSVFFPVKDTGYVCGNNGVILKTVDAGSTWTLQVSGTVQNLYCINFIGRDTGAAVGQNGTILQTVNGGSSWILKPSPVSADLFGLDFIDSKAMAVGASGKIIRTLNYGNTWDTISSPTSLTLKSVVWSQQKIAYAVGQGGVSLRFDGTNWASGPQATANDLNFVHSPFWKKGSDIRLASAWSVGDNGTILVLNPDICTIGVVSMLNTNECTWCFGLSINSSSSSSSGTGPANYNFTHFVFGTSTIHSYDWCQEGDMNVIGSSQYENTGQITSVPIIPGNNIYEVKVYDFIQGTAYPVNFRFYLYDSVNDYSCYIELDDIICCEPVCK